MTHSDRMYLAWAGLLGFVAFVWFAGRGARSLRFAHPYLYLGIAVLWWAALPAISGDWVWSVVFLGAGLTGAFGESRHKTHA